MCVCVSVYVFVHVYMYVYVYVHVYALRWPRQPQGQFREILWFGQNSPNCPRVHSQFGQNPYCERGVPISSVAQSALQMLRSLHGLEHES